METLLGERGTGLSKGQMQRIAIARAIYSRCPILLLDEATSALDEATERQVLENLKSMTDKTVVIVTHRPATLEICDRVLQFTENGVIDNGKNELSKNAADMIYLTACALNRKVPKQERVERLDLTKLFEVCQMHILTACVAYALESAGVHDHDFTQAKEKAIRKNFLLDAERARILKRLEAEKIWYMLLKGSILKDWYPKLGMRQMSDNDILFDMSRRDHVRKIMYEFGFKLKAEREVVDEYLKEPIYNFEMHGELFMKYQVGEMADYYRGIKKRMTKDTNNDHGYHFSNDEFYLFMLAHEYKHFSLGGTGVRSLVDTYVFLSKFADKLNWAHIDEELEKLGIADYERQNREIAMKTFAMKPLTVEDKKLLDYYIISGTYGIIENSIENRLQKNADGSKLRYILQRIFPSMEVIRTFYPFFYRHKWLIPVLLVYRPFHGLFKNRKKIKAELQVFSKNKGYITFLVVQRSQIAIISH